MLYQTMSPGARDRSPSRRSILLFVLVAYGLAWLPVFALHSIKGLGGFAFVGFGVSPGLAALVVISRHGGLLGVRSLMASARPSTVSWRTTGVIVLGVIWFITLTQGTTTVVDSSTRHWPVLAAWSAAAASLPVVVISAFLEELGWRGFLLPALQARWSALTASMLVGVVWGCWHLPLLLQADSPNAALPVWWYPAAAGVSAVVYAAVFNATRGSVWATTVVHVTMNTLTAPFMQDRYDRGLNFSTASVVSLALMVALAATIVACTGANDLAVRSRTVITL